MKNFSPILLITFLVYVCLSIVGMLSHELSLDEAHHWLLARDSTSISNLIYNARYDGHPLLWDLILFFVSFISKKVIAMQVAHLLISTIAAFLFLRYSPFSVLQKILITFGYFFFFEYNLICRGYNLTWLFLIIICILFTKEKRNYLLITLLLALLANTHLFSLVCSIPIFILLLKEFFQEKNSSIIILGSSILFIAGIAASVWTLIPPTDSGFMLGAVQDLHFSLTRSLNAFSFFEKGMFCLPDFTNSHFWNSNYFVTHFIFAAYALCAIAFLLPLFCFNKKDSLFIFYFSSITITILFYVLKLTVGAHYMGYCFMLFLVSFWFDRSYRTEAKYFSPMLSNFVVSIGNIIFWSVLLLQTFSGLSAFYFAHGQPFSEGKNVANDLLSRPGLEDGEIIVMPFNSGPPIAAYLDRPLFYPENDSRGTFCMWNTTLIRDKKYIAGKINETLNLSTAKTLALVLSYSPEEMSYLENSLALDPHFYYRIKDVRFFNNAISSNGNYTVFYFERINKK